MEYILCAAVHYQDGKNHIHQPKNIALGCVITGFRHSNCFYTVSLFGDKVVPIEQGFLTSCNRFVNRTEAAEIVKSNGKISFDGNELHSEDLY